MRLIAAIALPFALAACTAAWNEDYNSMKRPDAISVPYEVQTSRGLVVRELDPTRKVADVDCAKPFDPSLGNVRCR